MNAAGLGQLSDLADAAGVSVSAISATLAYRRSQVSAGRLAPALGCSASDLESDPAERQQNRKLHDAWIAGGRRSIVVAPGTKIATLGNLLVEVGRLRGKIAAAKVLADKLRTECHHECACANLIGHDCDCGAQITIELRRVLGEADQ
jgi:hypothetical protein